jgi:hypothetical protein
MVQFKKSFKTLYDLRSLVMSIEKQIDDLIEAGWYVLDSNLDPVAFQNWRNQASDCIIALLGPHHTYTEYFNSYVQYPDPKNLLAGSGILTAAREEMVKNCPDQHQLDNCRILPASSNKKNCETLCTRWT